MAFTVAPIEESTEVKQVPTFAPKIMHIAICSDIRLTPDAGSGVARAITIAVSAADDCIIAVSAAPRRNSTITSQVRVCLPRPIAINTFCTAELMSPLASIEFTAPDIMLNPKNISPTPSKILPMRLTLSFLHTRVITNPIKAIKAKIAVTEK